MQIEQTKARCFMCDREIRNDHWFARFPVDGERVLFCEPYCVIIYLDNQDGKQMQSAMDGAAKGVARKNGVELREDGKYAWGLPETQPAS